MWSTIIRVRSISAGNKKQVKEIKKKLKGVPDTNDGVGLDVDVDTDTDDAAGSGAAGVEVDTGAAGVEYVMNSEEEEDVDQIVDDIRELLNGIGGAVIDIGELLNGR